MHPLAGCSTPLSSVLTRSARANNNPYGGGGRPRMLAMPRPAVGGVDLLHGVVGMEETLLPTDYGEDDDKGKEFAEEEEEQEHEAATTLRGLRSCWWIFPDPYVVAAAATTYLAAGASHDQRAGRHIDCNIHLREVKPWPDYSAAMGNGNSSSGSTNPTAPSIAERRIAEVENLLKLHLYEPKKASSEHWVDLVEHPARGCTVPCRWWQRAREPRT